jgi:hypothetical protein
VLRDIVKRRPEPMSSLPLASPDRLAIERTIIDIGER